MTKIWGVRWATTSVDHLPFISTDIWSYTDGLQFLPDGHLRSSSVIRSTPAKSCSLNSSILLLSGRRPDKPLITTSSPPALPPQLCGAPPTSRDSTVPRPTTGARTSTSGNRAGMIMCFFLPESWSSSLKIKWTKMSSANQCLLCHKQQTPC